jgi:hypothetical protein
MPPLPFLGNSRWILFALLGAVPLPVLATQRHVPDQHPAIQAAIDAAADQDEIIVSPGTYRESLNLGTKRIILRGTVPENPVVVAATVVDGNADGKPGRREGPTLTISGGQGRETVISGLTITGGTGRLEGRVRSGGGVFISGSSPTLASLRVQGNRAQFGGGIFCRDGAPLITCNVIADNRADLGGGGLRCVRSPGAEVVGNLIISNTAADSTGGGIDVSDCSGTGPSIANNTIVGNHSPSREGSGINTERARTVIRNNLMTANDNYGIAVRGGTPVTIVYNDFWGNANGPCWGVGTWGPTNLAVDPLFVDADGPDDRLKTWQDNDYHLSAASPCINAADPAFVPSHGATDIDGQPRVLHFRVDIGADEATCTLATGATNVTARLSYCTIQAAIDEASAGDEIVVKPGTYLENIAFNGKNIILRSQAPGDPAVVATTVIDGSLPANPAVGSVITFAGTENASCLVNGLTVTGGTGTAIGDPEWDPWVGGGVLGNGCTATISNCRILENQILATEGQGAGLYDCDGEISGCTITGNRAAGRDFGSAGGGLAYCDGSITNCRIAGNEAGPGSLGMGLGGGLYACNASISNCTVSANIADDAGGGLCYCDGPVSRCVISDNFSEDGGGLCYCNGVISACIISDNYGADGGGGLNSCNNTIRDCLITGNYSTWGAGLSGCSATISSCTIAQNTGYYGAGLAWCTGTISNCIIWANTATHGQPLYEVTPPTYCCIEGWIDGGTGNINADPRFAEMAGDMHTILDYHLQAGSPCIDAGDPNGDYTGRTDLDGHPRVSGGMVDMGAYEAQEPPTRAAQSAAH